MERIVVSVVGMNCQRCVQSVTSALEALPGVEEVIVSLATGVASVACDSTQVSAADLRRAIEDAGFDAPGGT
ncbi:MAG TPA: heavy-metal-associated domain-containing protein [Accumulibacter sp.]|uniref:heavy-metal-associated domain-containing protein n=1 Tax=Accumulibacter sp. TaxID=2053492 RepID=UPI0025D05E61|nr:heavy-metal-associated domain-containing protein [Accumulibacter sp.]MCM8597255.1 heavy-metal-associated domain-containing protein [Accumulibacter sp.]MCM8661503.1 heavy-metal-associated domain-containing protein [Accumulibacter sp.]HNC52662.1 heavy-metal-associated domain-containing protein [Accumulibacter sp.]